MEVERLSSLMMVKQEKIRIQFLQRSEPVKEEIGGEVLAMRDNPEKQDNSLPRWRKLSA